LRVIGEYEWARAFAQRQIKSALSSSPKSRQQLLNLTKIPERTLRYNLAILKKTGSIKEILTLSDMRRKIFALNKIKRAGII